MLRSYGLIYKIGLALLGVSLAIGIWSLYSWNARLIRVGELKIDPLTEIDPNKRYEITLWEQPLYLPNIDPQMRQNALEAAAAEINEAYPNFTVVIKILEDPSNDYLMQALEAEVGPDIVGIVSGGLLLDEKKQIPITPYIQVDTDEDLFPSVKAGISYANHIWAWPRWVSNPVWLGYFNKVNQLYTGLSISAQSFIEQGTQHNINLGYNVYDPSFLYDIITSSTGHSMLSSSGELLWTEQVLIKAAEFIRTLISNGIITKAADDEARTRLSRFYNKQIEMIAPVHYPLLHSALSRLGEITYDDEDEMNAHSLKKDLIILAPPFLDEYQQGTSGNIAGYAVLAKENTSSDHIKACMIVAHHMSKRAGLWEASKILAVPAYTSALNQWQKATGLPSHHSAILLEMAARVVTPGVINSWAQLELRALEEVVIPALIRFLSQPVTPEEFAKGLINSINAFIISQHP